MGPFSIEPSVTITYEFQLWRNSNGDAGRKSNSFSETYQNTIKWFKMGPFVHYIEKKVSCKSQCPCRTSVRDKKSVNLKNQNFHFSKRLIPQQLKNTSICASSSNSECALHTHIWCVFNAHQHCIYLFTLLERIWNAF